jgi:hypothetical protein
MKEDGGPTPVLGILWAELLAVLELVASLPACSIWYSEPAPKTELLDVYLDKALTGVVIGSVFLPVQVLAVFFWFVSIEIFVTNWCWQAGVFHLTLFVLVSELSTGCTGLGVYMVLSKLL